MLMAVLYCEPNQIAAAAFACDQMAIGDAYWTEVFVGQVQQGSIFETAYVTVNNHELCYKLLNIGIDEQFDGVALAAELESTVVPRYVTERAA